MSDSTGGDSAAGREADLLALVAVGGAVGALARWGLAEALPPDPLAWGTLAANTVGCFALGALLTALLALAPDSRRWRALLGVGLLGGFTTFSTAMLEAHALLLDGRLGLAALELALGLGLGLVAVVAGTALVRRALAHRLPAGGAERR